MSVTTESEIKFLWFSTKDSHLKDIMAHCEPTKAAKDYLNRLPTKVIRLAFYGMFRKPERSPLDTFLVTDIFSKDCQKKTRLVFLFCSFLFVKILPFKLSNVTIMAFMANQGSTRLNWWPSAGKPMSAMASQWRIALYWTWWRKWKSSCQRIKRSKWWVWVFQL